MHGVDIDFDYIMNAKNNIMKKGLQDQITVGHESIYDHRTGPGKLYDVVYFGASFMLMPGMYMYVASFTRLNIH